MCPAAEAPSPRNHGSELSSQPSDNIYSSHALPNPTESQLYTTLRSWPRPHYPFPSCTNPQMEAIYLECNDWIDADCPFQSATARKGYKKHRLTDIAARGFPLLSIEELRPIARFTAFFAIIDDYMDRGGRADLEALCQQVSALLKGEETVEPGPGFWHQVYMIREDAMHCGMPLRLYEYFVETVLGTVRSFGAEKRYNELNKPTSLRNYQEIRRQSSGGLPYSKYLCMQRGYRTLPDRVLCHPIILRMHDLVASLIGYHNDFISLPKELGRKGDVMNIVLSVQAEYGLDLRSAYMRALEIHDVDLAELVRLPCELPDFGELNNAVLEYVKDLGIMLKGVYDWHIISSYRYSPGAYVEPEWLPQDGPAAISSN